MKRYIFGLLFAFALGSLVALAVGQRPGENLHLFHGKRIPMQMDTLVEKARPDGIPVEIGYQISDGKTTVWIFQGGSAVVVK